ncbi:MAG: acyltransferase family protein, partial [Gemmatimonadota bacterium]|nr:acyltransferase family protein [Gemmatimonadota bacterium]
GTRAAASPPAHPVPSTRDARDGANARRARMESGASADDVRSTVAAQRIDWLDPVKALALIAILLNHLVEEFGPGPWFTNPENAWPTLAVRLHSIVPPGATLFVQTVRAAGWLGDAAPGVFILASGVGLTLSALADPASTLDARSFYRRRLLRLFPLYIAMHFVVLAGSLLVPGNVESFAGLRTMLSLAGVRALPGTFFHISPSWWFVWLILQLYIVYPYLFRALRTLGPTTFFAAALVATIAARGIGLELPRGRYAWLTGLFFASRLAEFAVGMVLAQMIVSRREAARTAAPAAPSTLAIFAMSLPCYLLGLLASFTLPGALVSNLLVTVGMTGIFWAVWQSVLRPEPLLASSAQWLGRRSYAVFLLHQPPLQWTASWFGNARGAHLAAAIGALSISVPAAAALEDASNRAMKWRPSSIAPGVRRALALVCSVGVAALTITVIGTHEPTELVARAGAWLCAVALCALAFFYWTTRGAMSAPERFVALTALLGGALSLFVGPGTSGGFALGLGAVCAGVLMLLQPRRPALALRMLAALVFLGASAVVGELALRRVAPLETAVWGELPALQTDSTRTFALIPNRTTRLRYNDYDYTVSTNSLGLTSPEIASARPTPNTFRVFVTGDAFTMPEGVNYDRSYPALLNAKLAGCLAPRPVQVINGGVTGYGPNEERAELQQLAPRYRPDVIVEQFYINELSDVTIAPAEFRRGIGLDLASRSTVRRLRDRSQIKTRIGRMARAAKETLTGHPGAWRYDLAQLDYYRAGDNPLYDAHTLRLIASALAGMKQVADSSGAHILVAFVPGAVAVSDPARLPHFPRGENLRDASAYDLGRPYRALRQIADSLGIKTIDLTSDLRATGAEPAYYPASWHWTPSGHEAAAGAIERTLDTLGFLGAHCS